MTEDDYYGRALYQLKAAGSLNLGKFVRAADYETCDQAADALHRMMQLPDVEWDGVTNGNLTWIGK